MKRFLSLLLCTIIILCTAACDFSTEDELSKSDDKSEVAISNSDESDLSNAGNTSNDDNSNSESTTEDSNEQSNVISDEDVSDEDIPEESENSINPDEIIEKTIDDITISINGKKELEANGYKISSNFNTTVSVTVKGKASVISSIGSASITASINVANVSEKGEIELVINYSAPEGVDIISKSTSLTKLNIEQVSSIIVPPDESEVRIVNGVLISGTRAMEQFGGSASGGAKTAAMLNKFKQTMGNVNVYVLPAPLASAFYAPKGYEGSIKKHQDCFYGMRDALDNVGFVDTLSALSTHVNEEIYFRTDHHWQALAAYYACEEFAKVAGVPFDNISTFRMNTEEGMLGSFYSSYTHDAVLGNNPDTLIWYEPTREHTVEYYGREGHKGEPITGRTLFSTNKGYTKFTYGDSYTTHIKTNVGNGRKLLVFKDSYGNALSPFLVGSFDEIVIADYRYFKTDVSDFIAEQGITDVLFSLAAFKVNNCNAVDIKY